MHNEGAVRTPLGIRSQEGDCGYVYNRQCGVCVRAKSFIGMLDKGNNR